MSIGFWIWESESHTKRWHHILIFFITFSNSRLLYVLCSRFFAPNPYFLGYYCYPKYTTDSYHINTGVTSLVEEISKLHAKMRNIGISFCQGLRSVTLIYIHIYGYKTGLNFSLFLDIEYIDSSEIWILYIHIISRENKVN